MSFMTKNQDTHFHLCMSNVLHGLQLWAVRESLKNHSDVWSLAQGVFEWLNDITTNEDELQGILGMEETLHRSKARVKEINGGRIARTRLRGI
jgi:AMMECR1 domain-containing protein